MAIVHRRVFFGKSGTGDQIVGVLQEGEALLAQAGAGFKTRILTDHMSGRTDRVVAEWEANDMGEIEAAMGKAMANSQVQASFRGWVEKLESLIHYAEVENWSIR